MIITRTPFRISFVGGGSDLASFYREHGGAVLSTTINKFMYISTHRFFDEAKIRVKYAKTETVTTVDELQHPILREALRAFRIGGAVEISSNADIPSKTGLGSSSSFTVGLLHALYVRAGKYVTKARLAHEACELEIDKLGEPIGKQDQYAAAFGGLNVIRFHPAGTVDVEPLHVQHEVYRQLQANLLMFYTGDQRKASSILEEQQQSIKSPDKSALLQRMVTLVDDLRSALYAGDLRAFGEILHENWQLKQQLSGKISSSYIDERYAQGRNSGALGGKLLGAGGGGFILFYCEPEHHERLRAAMVPLRELRFKLESEGTKLIYIGDEYEDDN